MSLAELVERLSPKRFGKISDKKANNLFGIYTLAWFLFCLSIKIIIDVSFKQLTAKANTLFKCFLLLLFLWGWYLAGFYFRKIQFQNKKASFLRRFHEVYIFLLSIAFTVPVLLIIFHPSGI